MRLIQTTLLDLKVQFRSGLLFLYLGLTLFYIVVLKLIPPPWDRWIFPLIIATDPTVMGFLFVGALIQGEKDQGVLSLVAVSPLTLSHYLGGKIISLGLISTVTAGLVTIVIFPRLETLGWTLLAVAVTAPLFTLLGVSVSLGFRSLSSFFMMSGLVDIPAVAPFLLGWLNISSPLLFLLPTQTTWLLLTRAGGAPISAVSLVLGGLTLGASTAAAWIGARRSLNRTISGIQGEIK